MPSREFDRFRALIEGKATSRGLGEDELKTVGEYERFREKFDGAAVDQFVEWKCN
jgi:hypothetical protein